MVMRTLSALVAIAAMIAVTTRSARADDHPLAVIVVVGVGAGEVADRVEGQVSDLAVTLLRIDEATWSATAADDPLAAAAHLAAPRRARVVVWFDADDAAWTVHVAEPAAGRLLSRRVEAEGDLASSASAEAVALVVRAALSAIADGGSIGVTPPPAPTAPPPPTPPPPPTARRTYAALGWTGMSGGAGPRLQHGASARLGVALGRWRTGVALAVHAPIALDDPGATMELSRASLGVLAARDVIGGGASAWLVSFELGAAVTRFARTTTGADAPLAPTPSTVIWAPTVTPTLRAARRLARATWLELSAGADVLLRVPEFGLATPGGFMTYAQLTPVQPQVAISLVLDTP